MSLYDLIVRNGTLVAPDGLKRADLGIDDGRIAAVAPDLDGAGTDEIDATGLHVFPGLIDAHVHFNEPGRTNWEGFATGTAALAAGGMTTFFDMPLNAHPPTLDAESFRQKHAAAQGQALVDYALWGGLVPGQLDRLDELAACGVVGFKAFMCNSGIEDFPAADDLTLFEGMARAARLGRVVAVHAENDALTGALARRAVAEGHVSARDYLASRPVVAELEAISRAIAFAEETGCALHIVHVSTGRGAALVAEARARGVDVSCETCPHYLLLTGDDVERLGAVAKCAPPLRSVEDREELWRAVMDGSVSMIASDHSPGPPDLKRGGDFFRIWGGISGCQSTLRAMLTEGYHKRKLSLAAIARLMADYPARRFGLSPRKGRLDAGADADFALVDLAFTGTLRADDLLYRHRYSPYVGMDLRGRVARTVLRGITVYRDGKVVSAPIGRLIKVKATGVQPAARDHESESM